MQKRRRALVTAINMVLACHETTPKLRDGIVKLRHRGMKKQKGVYGSFGYWEFSCNEAGTGSELAAAGLPSGSWGNNASFCRVADRDNDLGFRLALVPVQ